MKNVEKSPVATIPEVGQPSESGEKLVRMVVVALILRGREVLICQRRSDQPMALKWEFPGGKMEPGESAEEALARELDEELGINAKIGPRITRMRHTYRSGSAVDLQFFAVHEFVGDITNRIFNRPALVRAHRIFQVMGFSCRRSQPGPRSGRR